MGIFEFATLLLAPVECGCILGVQVEMGIFDLQPYCQHLWMYIYTTIFILSTLPHVDCFVVTRVGSTGDWAKLMPILVFESV